MKKIITLTLVLIMLVSLVACAGGKTNEIKLGTSEYSLVLPEGYAKTDDDYSEDQIAYYYKDDLSIDFEVYQWAKEGIYTLESEAEYYAYEYGVDTENIEINGINCIKYVTVEEYDGFAYTVVNYMFENEDTILEIAFWTINSEAEFDAVDDIINTLKKN